MADIHGSPASEPQGGVSGFGIEAPYYPGDISPIQVHGDPDPGGRDDVSGTVEGAVAAAQARNAEYESDTFGPGSTYGDVMTLPPNGLDPAASSPGTTDPAGAFYDPPRDYGG